MCDVANATAEINEEPKNPVFSFPSSHEALFIEALAKINKRLAKYGDFRAVVVSRKLVSGKGYRGFGNEWRSAFPELSDNGELSDEAIEEFNSFIDGLGKQTYDIDRVYVEVESPKFIHLGKEVTYLGNINTKSGIQTIYSETEKYVLGDLELKCQHCNTKRNRNKYFAFECEGKPLLIGSTCVKDYYGDDIVKILTIWSEFESLASEGEDYGDFFGSMGCRADRGISLYDIVKGLYIGTNNFSSYWISKEKAEAHRQPSSSSLASYYAGTPPRLTKYNYEEVQEFIAKQKAANEALSADEGKLYKDIVAKTIEKWIAVKPQNDMEHNIINNLFFIEDDGNRVVRTSIKSFGIVAFAIWQANFIAPEKQEKKGHDLSKSQFFGEVGKRYEFTAEVLWVNTVESNFGTSTIVTLITEDGNILKTFTSGEFGSLSAGDKVKFKGTVKKHECYKGRRETSLSRCAKAA